MAYATYDLDDLKAKMESRWDGVPFWDDTEAKNGINEALLTWNALTGFWKRRVTVDTVAGQQDYELPSTLVFNMRVEYNSTPINQTSTEEMDEGKPGWQGDIGVPKMWMPLDLINIRLWPAPQLSNQVLTLDGVAATPQLTYDGDSVDIGSEALTAVVGYTLHILALKEGGQRFKSTMPLFQSFLSAAAEENNQLLKSEMFRHFMGIDTQLEPTR